MHKYVYFPQFVLKEDYDIPYNPAPMAAAFLSGATFAHVYPIRSKVRKMVRKCSFLSMAPSRCFIGPEYIKALNDNCIGITDASIWGVAIKKYFEIPAAGSLLLAERCKDVDRVGHVPGETYVEIDEDNFIDQIKDIISHYKDYLHIRNAGREFVFEHHTQYHRFDLMLNSILEIL